MKSGVAKKFERPLQEELVRGLLKSPRQGNIHRAKRRVSLGFFEKQNGKQGPP